MTAVPAACALILVGVGNIHSGKFSSSAIIAAVQSDPKWSLDRARGSVVWDPPSKNVQKS